MPFIFLKPLSRNHHPATKFEVERVTFNVVGSFKGVLRPKRPILSLSTDLITLVFASFPSTHIYPLVQLVTKC